MEAIVMVPLMAFPAFKKNCLTSVKKTLTCFPL